MRRQGEETTIGQVLFKPFDQLCKRCVQQSLSDEVLVPGGFSLLSK
jgi:hypothetical protein